MLDKCANPACLTACRSLGRGKLFQIESKKFVPSEALGGRRVRSVRHHVERYWLCDECAISFTLAPEKFGGVAAIPVSILNRRPLPLPQA
jgi:hypothetical protein